jgi:hypothetical protein
MSPVCDRRRNSFPPWGLSRVRIANPSRKQRLEIEVGFCLYLFIGTLLSRQTKKALKVNQTDAGSQRCLRVIHKHLAEFAT